MDATEGLAVVSLASSGEEQPGFAVDTGTLRDLLRLLPQGATVLDVGCDGWKLPAMASDLGRFDLRHIGADLYGEPAGRPAGASFLAIETDGAAFGTALADLVVSSHCLEHSAHPMAAFASLLRAARPDGLVYVEAPSELSALRPASSDPRDQAFTSFWDDPTHVRPWPPGALYRLAIGYAAVPLRCGRFERGGIPCAAIVCRAPAAISYRYVTLANAAPGVEAAMRAVWGQGPTP